jgi:predicted DNA-binding protein YlxM (UPF0122 family)
MEQLIGQNNFPDELPKQLNCPELEEIVQLSILYDFYGDLLKSHKKQIFEDYILNDLSLSEIAAEQGISRQGVYDIVKRCSQELKGFEEKLGLVRKFKSVKEKLEQMKVLLSQTELSEDYSRISEIGKLADDILKEL